MLNQLSLNWLNLLRIFCSVIISFMSANMVWLLVHTKHQEANLVMT